MLRILTLMVLLLPFQKGFAQEACKSLFSAGIGSMKIIEMEDQRPNKKFYLTLNKDIIPKNDEEAHRSFSNSHGIWILGWNYYKVKITFNYSKALPKGTTFKIDNIDEIGAHDGYESAIYISSDDRKYRYPDRKEDFFASFEIEIDGAGKNTVNNLTVDQIQKMLGNIFTLTASED